MHEMVHANQLHNYIRKAVEEDSVVIWHQGMPLMYCEGTGKGEDAEGRSISRQRRRFRVDIVSGKIKILAGSNLNLAATWPSPARGSDFQVRRWCQLGSFQADSKDREWPMQETITRGASSSSS